MTRAFLRTGWASTLSLLLSSCAAEYKSIDNPGVTFQGCTQSLLIDAEMVGISAPGRKWNGPLDNHGHVQTVESTVKFGDIAYQMFLELGDWDCSGRDAYNNETCFAGNTPVRRTIFLKPGTYPVVFIDEKESENLGSIEVTCGCTIDIEHCMHGRCVSVDK